MPVAKIPDDQREAALDLIYDRRRDGYDPLQRLLELQGLSPTPGLPPALLADLPLPEDVWDAEVPLQ